MHNNEVGRPAEKVASRRGGRSLEALLTADKQTTIDSIAVHLTAAPRLLLIMKSGGHCGPLALRHSLSLYFIIVAQVRGNNYGAPLCGLLESLPRLSWDFRWDTAQVRG